MRCSRILVRGAALVAALSLPATVSAQDTARGVRIGLQYDPGMKPGILVLPVTGPQGDSIRGIIHRDFDYSDRLAVITLSAADAALFEGRAPSGGPVPLNFDLFARLGAAAVVKITPTAAGVHVALHDVGRKQVARVEDFAIPAAPMGREWRHGIHGVADAIENWITGQRGIAQTRIAFVDRNVIKIIDSDGAETVSLPEVGESMSPSWHSSGHLIAYHTFGLESRVVVHDLRTGRSRSLGSQRNATPSTPVFTPDGRSLAYALATEQGTDLYVVPLSLDAFPRRITIGRGSINTQPSFSPDGNRVAFMSDRMGPPQVYIMDADGTNTDIFTAFDFGDQNYRASPDWSPDGRQVAFQTRIDGRFQIFTMSLRDRQPRQLTSEGENEDPSWAPDGRHLVFVSSRSGTRQLWVLDTESGRLRQLTQAGGPRLPAWSPRLGGN